MYNYFKTFVNGKKSMLAVNSEDNNVTLLSYVKEWHDPAAVLENMKGFFYALNCGNISEVNAATLSECVTDILGIEPSEVLIQHTPGYNEFLEAKQKEIAARRAAKKTPEPTPTPTPEPEPTPTPTPTPTPAANTGTGIEGLSMLINCLRSLMFSGEMREEMRKEIRGMLNQLLKEMGAGGGFTQKLEVKILDKVNEVPGIKHAVFESCLDLLANGINLYLWGPAGTGKNVLAEQLATALGVEFAFDTCISDKVQLDGFIDAGGNYHTTAFRKAVEEGKMYFADEIDASCNDILPNINQALGNGYYNFPDGPVKFHPNFRCIASANTNGGGATEEYTGRVAMDASTLDRFMMVRVGYDSAIEKSAAGGDMEVVDFVHALRTACDETGISMILGTRCIKRLAIIRRLPHVPMSMLLDGAIIRNTSYEDMAMVTRRMKCDDNNAFYRELKKMVL